MLEQAAALRSIADAANAEGVEEQQDEDEAKQEGGRSSKKSKSRRVSWLKEGEVAPSESEEGSEDESEDEDEEEEEQEVMNECALV